MKYFLCVPFSSRVDDAGNVYPEYRALIEELTNHIRSCGHEYFVALEYAGWKIGGDTDPEEELRHDFAQIDACDALIVLLEERVSSGVQLENGYAYAKGKKMHVFQIGKATWSNTAFAKIAGQGVVQVQDEREFIDKAKEFVSAQAFYASK